MLNCIRTISIEAKGLYVFKKVYSRHAGRIIYKNKQHFKGVLLNMSVIYFLNIRFLGQSNTFEILLYVVVVFTNFFVLSLLLHWFDCL